MGLGANIKRHREGQGLTLEKLSKASHVPIGTISALEVRDSSRTVYATAIAAALGMTVEQLTDEGFQPETQPRPALRELVAAVEHLPDDSIRKLAEALSEIIAKWKTGA